LVSDDVLREIRAASSIGNYSFSDLTGYTLVDVVEAHRTVTQAELIRGKLRLTLDLLQKKFEAVCVREETAAMAQECDRVDAISN
jgi:hypothetical protein